MGSHSGKGVISQPLSYVHVINVICHLHSAGLTVKPEMNNPDPLRNEQVLQSDDVMDEGITGCQGVGRSPKTASTEPKRRDP